MLTFSWRRAGASSALAMVLVVGLPALAQAQLFPNMWIQRQRTSCAAEPPFYGHVRRDYFGYFPTCWQRFPDGWGCPCPNPEAPNAALAFQKQPRDDKSTMPPPPELGEDMTDERGNPAPGGPAGAGPGVGPNAGSAPGTGPGAGRRPGGDPFLPPVPNDSRSPFDIDSKRPAVPTTPGDDPLLRPGRAPAPLVPGGATPGSAPLFDPAAPTPRSGPGTGTGPSASLDSPGLDRPTSTSSRRSSPSPTATDESNAPLLALPEIMPPSGSLPAEPAVALAMPPSLPTTGAYIESANTSSPVDPSVKPDPVQAPRRPSLLGGLFGLTNRRRR